MEAKRNGVGELVEEMREANETLHRIELYTRGAKSAAGFILGIMIAGIIFFLLPFLMMGR